jgi:predicted ATPase
VSEILWGLWTFYTLRAELVIAREIAEEFLRLAETLSYPGLAMRGHWALEITFLHLGEFTLALEHYEKALVLYDPKRHLDDAFFYALNPGAAMPCFAAWALWFHGCPEQASSRMQEALARARELSEPLSLAHAFLFAAILSQLRREEELTQEYADATFAVSGEHGLALYQPMATIMRGWVLLRQGRHEEAIAQMREGLAALQETGTELVRPHFLGLLAEALANNGQTAEGLRILEEALDLAHSSGERDYHAELYRLKGELLLMLAAGRGASRTTAGREAAVVTEAHAVAEAEGCFSQSIKIAREQKARSWELRATMSLARLYQSRGEREKARRRLAQIYGTFDEGFDTADLIEAKAMLDESSVEC